MGTLTRVPALVARQQRSLYFKICQMRSLCQLYSILMYTNIIFIFPRIYRHLLSANTPFQTPLIQLASKLILCSVHSSCESTTHRYYTRQDFVGHRNYWQGDHIPNQESISQTRWRTSLISSKSCSPSSLNDMAEKLSKAPYPRYLPQQGYFVSLSI